MTNSFMFNWITFSRFPLIFYSNIIEDNVRRKNLTHDCVEAYIKCKICGKNSFYTLEYSSAGRKLCEGRYEVYSKNDGIYEYEPENMNLKYLYDIFDKVWYNISGKDYNIANRNCKDHAQSICHMIKNSFYETDEKKSKSEVTFDDKANFTFINIDENLIVKKSSN